MLYTVSDDAVWLVVVQALDGVGAAIVGGALSAAMAGLIIVAAGYTVAF